MIRNLKVLMLSAMALAAFGAISASASQAAEFHCSVEPCTATLLPDGVVGTKAAHHVFIVKKEGKSISSTCNQITGTATSAKKTSATLLFTGVIYHGCTFIGQAATVSMHKCSYLFNASGTVTIQGCEPGEPIEITIPGCTATIGNQGPLGKLTYKNVGTSPTRTVTAETLVTGIVGALDGTEAGCGGIKPGEFTEGEYTTGNTIVTAETEAGVMADGWWE